MSATAPGSWPRYRLYGVTMASDFPFANRLAPGSGPCDLTFSRVFGDGPAIDLEALAPAYATPLRPGRRKPLIRIYLLEADGSGCSVVVVRIADIADYYLSPERILCCLSELSYDYLAEIHLLGYIFSIWLESRGVPALHASAVVQDERAIAFLAGHKAGKSSLAACFMQAGFTLLTDDILPLACGHEGCRGRPGYPQMRLWPDQAEHFLGRHRDLEIVHPAYTKRRVPVGADGFGAFRNRSAALGCLYLPEMREDSTDVEIEPVPPRVAFAQLMRCSFVGPVADALGWQPRRLPALAQVASTVPVRRLRYPPTIDRLIEVRQTILADVAALAEPSRRDPSALHPDPP